MSLVQYFCKQKDFPENALHYETGFFEKNFREKKKRLDNLYFSLKKVSLKNLFMVEKSVRREKKKLHLWSAFFFGVFLGVFLGVGCISVISGELSGQQMLTFLLVQASLLQSQRVNHLRLIFLIVSCFFFAGCFFFGDGGCSKSSSSS